jgi:hypothetical protein
MLPESRLSRRYDAAHTDEHGTCQNSGAAQYIFTTILSAEVFQKKHKDLRLGDHDKT